jgi:putative transcriptional regulator
MSETDTTRVTVKLGEPFPRGRTDWTRLDAMSDKEAIDAAQSDPDAPPLTPERLAEMRRVSRVKALRQRLGMTQAEFAEAFHLPITTLRDWEQRRSTPDAPARALLLAIERDPKVIVRRSAGDFCYLSSTRSWRGGEAMVLIFIGRGALLFPLIWM